MLLQSSRQYRHPSCTQKMRFGIAKEGTNWWLRLHFINAPNFFNFRTCNCLLRGDLLGDPNSWLAGIGPVVTIFIRLNLRPSCLSCFWIAYLAKRSVLVEHYSDATTELWVAVDIDEERIGVCSQCLSCPSMWERHGNGWKLRLQVLWASEEKYRRESLLLQLRTDGGAGQAKCWQRAT